MWGLLPSLIDAHRRRQQGGIVDADIEPPAFGAPPRSPVAAGPRPQMPERTPTATGYAPSVVAPSVIAAPYGTPLPAPMRGGMQELPDPDTLPYLPGMVVRQLMARRNR